MLGTGYVAIPLFPKCTYYGDVPHGHIVKFKYVKNGAKGMAIHIILVQYCGPKMCNCELVGETQH